MDFTFSKNNEYIKSNDNKNSFSEKTSKMNVVSVYNQMIEEKNDNDCDIKLKGDSVSVNKDVDINKTGKEDNNEEQYLINEYKINEKVTNEKVNNDSLINESLNKGKIIKDRDDSKTGDSSNLKTFGNDIIDSSEKINAKDLNKLYNMPIDEEKVKDLKDNDQDLVNKNSIYNKNINDKNINDDLESDDFEENNEISLFKKSIKNSKIIGQVFMTYIILEDADRIYLIDQHAAHERILYEILLEKNKEDILSQMLITPEIIELTGNELNLFRNNKIIFKRLGFEAEEFSNNSIIIRAAPMGINIETIKETFIMVLDNIEKNKFNSDFKLDEEIIIILHVNPQ
jgi:DNA mismatch repair ATPase MutL